jgi:hypothetical protein
MQFGASIAAGEDDFPAAARTWMSFTADAGAAALYWAPASALTPAFFTA